jgi:hypothetical protein
MRKDLQVLKKQVLSFDAGKRKECGYQPIGIPKAISNIGRPVSSDEFEYRFQMVTATTLWLQSILDKLNGLTSSFAIDSLKLAPFPHPSQFKAKRGRKAEGKKTQEYLLQKGFSDEQNRTGIGMRSWIKSSRHVSGKIGDVAREMLDADEPLFFMHIDEDGKVTSEIDPQRQRAFLYGPQRMANHNEENLLRALAKGKQKLRKK